MARKRHPQEPDIRIKEEYDKRKVVGGVTYLPIHVMVSGMVPEPIARRLLDSAHECIDCCGPAKESESA